MLYIFSFTGQTLQDKYIKQVIVSSRFSEIKLYFNKNILSFKMFTHEAKGSLKIQRKKYWLKTVNVHFFNARILIFK